MNIAQQYYAWRKGLVREGRYRRVDLANDLMVSLRTIERWLSWESAPKGNAVKRIEAEIRKAERRLKAKMPRG